MAERHPREVSPRSRRLALAIELLEAGIALQAQRYRREHPGASEAEVAAFVQAWLVDRPGAPMGDVTEGADAEADADAGVS
jgi:hypothetical protein